MPEPASSRSLEDILASIRRSLADESVDGLVELSAAAVDAARAETARGVAKPVSAAAAPEAAVPLSPADALAEDLLRDKLAGALVLETDVGEAEEDEAAAAGPDAAVDRAPEDEAATLAQLWVLRPGIEQAKPAAAPSESLSLDPFAGVRLPAEASKPVADFSLSPLELLGRATPAAKAAPLPTPPSPPAPSPAAVSGAGGVASVAPAAREAGGPPRLDAASMALLQKLRASNAAAIEKIAQDIELEDSAAEAEAVPPPEAGAPEADVPDEAGATALEAPEAAPFAVLLKAVTQGSSVPAAAVPVAEPEAVVEEAPPEVATAALPEPLLDVEIEAEPEAARPLLSMPERSTPLFGGHADARPHLTSGLDHLLPEAGVAPLKVDDVVADLSVPAADPPAVEAGADADAEAVLVPVEPDVEPVPDVIPQPEPDAATLTEPASATPPEPVATAPDTAPPPSPPPVEAASAPSPNKALEDMIAAVLEPVLQRLIETNVAPALELLVRREVERVLKEQRPTDARPRDP